MHCTQRSPGFVARSLFLVLPLALFALPSHSRPLDQALGTKLSAGRSSAYRELKSVVSDEEALAVGELAADLYASCAQDKRGFREALRMLADQVDSVSERSAITEYCYEYDPVTMRWYIICKEKIEAGVRRSAKDAEVVLHFEVLTRID